MAILVTHATVVSSIADAAPAVAAIRPTQWNAAHTVSISSAFTPDSDDGATLGSTSNKWSDLFLAEGGIIDWNGGQETIEGIVETQSFSGDAGTFPTLYFSIGGVVRTTLGNAWKTRDIKLSLPNYGSAADAIHVAGNSNGGGTVSFSRTTSSDPYIHGQVGDNSGMLLIEGFASNQNSWDGTGAIRLATDGVPGAAFPGNGIGSKWIFSLTPAGNTGYAERFTLRADGTATTEYDTNFGPTNSVLYMMDYQFRTQNGAPAAGIGIGLKFTLDTGGGNNEVGALLDVVATDVSSGSEAFDYIIKLMAGGGAAAEKFAVQSDGVVRTVAMAVGDLPAAGTAGRRAFVTDANSTAFASVVAAGGANGVPVYDDGANWRIG